MTGNQILRYKLISTGIPNRQQDSIHYFSLNFFGRCAFGFYPDFYDPEVHRAPLLYLERLLTSRTQIP
jgi:hypothetical protein